MKSRLRLSIDAADAYMQREMQKIAGKYKVSVSYDKRLINGKGYVYNKIDGDFAINISPYISEQGLLFKQADDIQFLNNLRALYHEEHHIIQNCHEYQSRYPSEETIIKSVRNLASDNNPEYYKDKNRYTNDLSEIEAEMKAIIKTHTFIKDTLKNTHADELICNLVKYRQKTCDYFFQQNCESFDEIMDAFETQYEKAQHVPIEGYIAYVLRPSQNINPKNDECMRYLQACVRENPNEVELMTQFNKEKNSHNKDLMIASITCHLHPEIEYEKVYPCLSDIDLSPENIFDRELPQPPEGLIKPIPKEDIERRIELAKFIHDKIIESEIRQYSDENKSHEKEVLNESLVSEHESEKTDEYGFM